ncbi:hypothetical protein [Erythrobacter sp. SG61-1L]|uniref:hypothetical protein n=1 Tax=Erythrobacter sp. SG61-1L TaxID=1603897 RepID=UPI0012E1D1C3|nr:hypothetical protein [Erythrobacter sp. SG61-1L]
MDFGVAAPMNSGSYVGMTGRLRFQVTIATNAFKQSYPASSSTHPQDISHRERPPDHIGTPVILRAMDRNDAQLINCIKIY